MARINGDLEVVGDLLASALGQNLSAAGFKLTNLGAPTSSSDAARKIDLDNALAGLDFQEDVLGLESDFVDTAGRYIYVNGATFATGVAAAAGDIVEVDAAGEITVLAYDVSAQGPGAMTWNRDTSSWYRWNGTNWAEFGGLVSYTGGNGIDITNNVVSVVAGDSSIVVDGDGVKVGDLSGTYATKTRFEGSYVTHTAGSSNTTHTVTHNLGNQYPIVQVIEDGEIIIPESVTFTNTNSLTVTLASAGTPIIIVHGLKAA